MTAPNMLNPITITGKLAVQAITTTANAIVTNSSASSKLVKINALYISNVDGINSTDVNIDVFRANVAYHLGKTVVVPADATLDVISKSIYLEEGDSLRLTAGADSDLEAVCSYEEIS